MSVVWDSLLTVKKSVLYIQMKVGHCKRSDRNVLGTEVLWILKGPKNKNLIEQSGVKLRCVSAWTYRKNDRLYCVKN